jgi:hypothetical protein
MKTPTRVVRRGEKGLFGFRLLLFCLLAAVLLAGCADTNAPVSPVAPVVSSWAFVDGTGADGINRQAFFYADLPQLTVFEGRLYATWQESNGISRCGSPSTAATTPRLSGRSSTATAPMA